MKSVTGKQLARLLRINGSHHIYGKDGHRERISLPIHGSESLKPGLFAHFLKQSGLKESDF